MEAHQLGLLVTLAGLALSPAPRLAAQEDDGRWLSRCEHDNWGDQEQFCEVRRTGFRPSGATLAIDPDQNGGIEVRGWDRDSVAVTSRIRTGASSEEEARALAGRIEVRISGSTIRVEGPSGGRGHNWGVILVLLVPRKTGLQAETVNGPLSVEGVSGTMQLRAQNGPVSLIRVGGDVRARVENGPLSVTLEGPAWEGRGLDAEAVNGPVDLALPEGYNAELETGTINGPMTLEMPLKVTLLGRVHQRIHSTLGAGGAPVRVVTTNGPITIRKSGG